MLYYYINLTGVWPTLRNSLVSTEKTISSPVLHRSLRKYSDKYIPPTNIVFISDYIYMTFVDRFENGLQVHHHSLAPAGVSVLGFLASALYNPNSAALIKIACEYAS